MSNYKTVDIHSRCAPQRGRDGVTENVTRFALPLFWAFELDMDLTSLSIPRLCRRSSGLVEQSLDLDNSYC